MERSDVRSGIRYVGQVRYPWPVCGALAGTTILETMTYGLTMGILCVFRQVFLR